MMRLPLVAMFGGSLGSGEVLVILLVALIVFGPHKLPTIARTLGRLMSDLRRSAREFTDELARAAAEKPSTDTLPTKPVSSSKVAATSSQEQTRDSHT